MLNLFRLDEILKNALAEDIGNGDITTMSTVGAERMTQGRFIAKEEGVICGIPVLKRVFEILDPAVIIEILVEEGALLQKGELIAKISGPARSILTGERVSLNLLQRMSGIATRTHEAVIQIAGTKASIADTRKRRQAFACWRNTRSASAAARTIAIIWPMES